MLQLIVAFAIITVAGESLIDEIPCLYLTVAGFHHALDPKVHRIDEGVVTLLCGLGNSMSLIALKLDALDIDVAHEVAALQQEEVVIHHWCVIDNYILPFFGEWYINSSFRRVCEVSQFAMEFTCIRAFQSYGHLVGITSFEHDIRHGLELHIP